jgi:hypothetical protein
MRALNPCPRNSSSHHLADPDAAARKLIEIANAVEAVQDGRINGSFLEEGGTPNQFRAALTARSSWAGCGCTSPALM